MYIAIVKNYLVPMIIAGIAPGNLQFSVLVFYTQLT